MSTSEKSERRSLALLEENRNLLEKELLEREPLRFREWKLLSELIELRRRNPENEFAAVKTPREAVLLVLTEHGDWMPKRAILERLEAGGFITGRVHRNNVRTLINYYTDPTKKPKSFGVGGDKMVLQRLGDKNDPEMLVGLMGWPEPKKKIGHP